MCVALPGKVICIHPSAGISMPADVEFPDGIRRIDLAMLDGVSEGDFVIAHSGFAIRRISTNEAQRSFDLWSSARSGH